MDQQDERDEVIRTYQAYTRAFLADDMDAINGLVLYPLAYVGDGKTVLLESFPFKPADLMASKQWHTTTNTEFEVVGVSSTKAHVILPRAKRLRADGSLIETVSAFYAFYEDRRRLENVRPVGHHSARLNKRMSDPDHGPAGTPLVIAGAPVLEVR